jgi:peptidoglycan/xylan/chitin deacetylase (PgdA/CDA1 family)
MVHIRKNVTIIVVASALLLATGAMFVIQQQKQALARHTSPDGQSSSSPTRCNCVIFRADDIQDYWKQEPQVALLDIFISKSVPLSVGLVMNHYGSDRLIVDKVREGGPLFEYDIHGWDHVDYTTLSAQQQEESISQAQAKIESVMGKDAKVFFAPYNNFDTNTLIAMKLGGLKIISASKADTSPYAPANDTLGILHMPQSINYGYANSTSERHAWRTVAEMKSVVEADIEARGWAVVTIHPQDFAKYDDGEENGGKMLNVADEQRVDTFKTFIDQLRAEGKTLTTFEGAVRIMDGDDVHPDLH